MNAVEIEEAISELAQQPFDPAEFPYEFLLAFGNKKLTIDRLRRNNSNHSDVDGGVLQRNNIHLSVCEEGKVKETLDALRASPATKKQKAKFILATDGKWFEAEDLNSGDVIACQYVEFGDHFSFWAPFAGISYTKELKDTEVDRKAVNKLNRLYVELLNHNPDWASAERRHDMNHFMARLIFCFFAEDTDIFHGDNLFTATIEQMTERDASNTHEVMGEIFRAMDTKLKDRANANIPRWADVFPYVNGELFSGSTETPKFSKIARSYLIHVGNLDWQQINPDIFGSMIQAVADDEERGALGMHYTSVPNILKVLNPLFLDDLRAQLKEAEDNSRKLLNLRKRMSRIRVFDPACGSGNFLVIAYKQMREIEYEINKRRGEEGNHSEISIRNFRGIELRDFSAEIARLALIIAEYQCNVVYRGQKEALLEFLPLDAQNWITQGNALQIDWLSVCPAEGKTVKLQGDDLFSTPLEQAQIDFENEGGETYICGNPPYLGFTWQTPEQKSDIERIFSSLTTKWKSLDYVAGWFMKAADYAQYTSTSTGFVSTSSINQGEQVSILWPLILRAGNFIHFAHASFKWANLASHNAGVTVVIVGISTSKKRSSRLFSVNKGGEISYKDVENINPYLVPAPNIIIEPKLKAPSDRAPMLWGNKPSDGGNLILSLQEAEEAIAEEPEIQGLIHNFVGSQEFVKGMIRRCIWVEENTLEKAKQSNFVLDRIEKVRKMRLSSKAKSTQAYAEKSHRFRQIQGRAKNYSIVVPKVTAEPERRPYLPVGLLPSSTIVSDNAFALYDAPFWSLALIASRIHLIWIQTVCGQLGTSIRYSNTLGWNTFPVPKLTEKNKEDLTRCAEDILLAREAHFPATIAELYDPKKMPENLRRAHNRNDEVLERIYIGRRFKNDTERLEKLFDLYTKMTSKKEAA
jgi:hypothetical protein